MYFYSSLKTLENYHKLIFEFLTQYFVGVIKLKISNNFPAMTYSRVFRFSSKIANISLTFFKIIFENVLHQRKLGVEQEIVKKCLKTVLVRLFSTLKNY